MDNKIIEAVEKISPLMIESIINIVQIDSVKSKALPGAPFGQGIKDALVKTLAMCDSLGFETTNIDNCIGYASYGKSKEYICAIGHLDVVAVGQGWKHPPFSGYMEDGVIYSRGILDNKGPILSCLFALYALKQLDISCKKEIRILFGCDEESGFADLEYYLTKEKPPIMGFTPDCKYPVVYGERGRVKVEITGHKDQIERFFDFINTYILNTKNNGDVFTIAYRDEEFGALEIRHYQLLHKEHPSVICTISYPASISHTKIIEKMQEVAVGFNVELVHNYDPVKFKKDCYLVETLTKAYETITHGDGTPVTTTGGTYAKRMPNIVPFGPSFPGQKDIGHLPNEWMTVEDIITNAKIYALSLYHLANGK